MGWSWGGFESLIIPTYPERARTATHVGCGRAVPAPRDRARGSRRSDRGSRRRASRGSRREPQPASTGRVARRDRPPAPAASARIAAGGPSAMIAAAVEHDHAVGVAEHDVHVVLGEQHGDALARARARRRAASAGRASAATSPRSARPSAAGAARRRAPARARRAWRRRRRASRSPGRRSCVIRTRSSSASASARSAIGRARADARDARRRARAARAATFSRTVIDANVAATWNVRPTPMPRDGARRQAVDALAAEQHGAGVGRELAVDEVEARRLAGAVRADQRDQLAGGDGERHVAHGVDAAERLGRVRRPRSTGVAGVIAAAARAQHALRARRRCPSGTRARSPGSRRPAPRASTRWRARACPTAR